MSEGHLRELADSVIARVGMRHRPIGIVLGTGLGDVAEKVEQRQVIGYEELSGFPEVSVDGHRGRLVVGRIAERDVVVLQGRSHYYEQGEMFAMKTPIQLLHAIGCETLFLTNAAGSLRRHIAPGSVLMIRDHINMTGRSPLFGERGTQRFVDMVDAYSPILRRALREVARRERITLHEGVYVFFSGPNFETPAEIRAAGRLGADVVGMSTAPEVIVARARGMKVAALSIITNYAAGIGGERLSHEHTLRAAPRAVGDIERLLIESLPSVQ